MEPKMKEILDACCGTGTVILEGCISGFNIEGCDNNLKVYQHTINNLLYYNYTANVYLTDIKDHNKKYDSAIIDLPYNLYSHTNDTLISNIIESTSKLAARIVIVSISDIESIIKRVEANGDFEEWELQLLAEEAENLLDIAETNYSAGFPEYYPAVRKLRKLNNKFERINA